jgi:site-specific recombinase XerD
VRPAFLSTRTVQELSIWRAESKHAGDEDFIFTLGGNAPVTNEGIIKAFRRGLTEMGLQAENWKPYWLHHSFGTYHLDELEDSELLVLMGHTNIVTNAIYRHPDDETVLIRSKCIREKMDNAREK